VDDNADEGALSEEAQNPANRLLVERLGAVRVQLQALRVHLDKGEGWDRELVGTHLEQIDRELGAISRPLARADGESASHLVIDRLPALAGYIDRDLRLRCVNRAVCRYYGRTRDDIVGRTVQEVVHPTIYARVRPGIEAALAGVANRFDDPPDGGPGVTEEHYVPRYGPDGAVAGFDFLSVDVAARRAAEAAHRTLAHRLLVGQEQERRELAHELHEGVGQALAGVALWLTGPGAPNAGVAGAQRLIEELAGRTRRLAVDLRPPELDDLGLLPALCGHVDRYQRRTGIRVDLRAQGVDRRFPSQVETVAFRMVQEALTNVARHAGVDEVGVLLAADSSVLTVAVRDAGSGFDPGATSRGGGLDAIRVRAELLNGTLLTTTSPGAGVAVTAILPLVDAGLSTPMA
jgi:PAS domain S-box-containing protein